jgi:hypothetical protein
MKDKSFNWLLEAKTRRSRGWGTLDHKTRVCHPYMMQTEVIDAYGNGCNEVYGADRGWRQGRGL